MEQLSFVPKLFNSLKSNIMLLTRTSQLSGKQHTMDLAITEEQIDNFISGVKVQDAFPHLKPHEREFILTGMTPEEWDDLVSFGE
jgi:hypothetical protein